MKKDLSFRGPLNLAVIENATTPDPGGLGVQVWSTTSNKSLTWNGTVWAATGGVANPNVIISSGAPVASPGTPKLWIQTGLGVFGQDITFWIEDGT
jgi:hypothetical protein